MTPDLDSWLPNPAVRVAHRRESSAPAAELWAAARAVQLADTGMLGRLVRWRIPGTAPSLSFEQLFSSTPFLVLHEDDSSIVSGLVGRIWTLRRDYPELSDPQHFREWSRRGTARVLFANWVEPGANGGSALASETRVQAIGRQGQLGLAAVRPLIAGFNHLVATEGIAAALRAAERAP